MTLGEIIRQYRKEHQINMDDFAKMCSLSKAYISILERNYNPSTKKPAAPSLATIKSVATAMGVDFNDLLESLDPDQQVTLFLEEKRPTPKDGDELLRLLDDPINRGIFEKLKAMSPEARKVALAQLDALAKYQDK